MLFPRNALASWPQDRLLAEKGITILFFPLVVIPLAEAGIQDDEKTEFLSGSLWPHR